MKENPGLSVQGNLYLESYIIACPSKDSGFFVKEKVIILDKLKTKKRGK